MDGSHSCSQCLAWISIEIQQELKSLQISFNPWDFSLWFCLRAFNSHSESNLHPYPSLCSCSFNCGWIWTRGAHTGFDDNWKTVTIWGLILCFRGDISRTWSFNYEHISCLPLFFLQKRWDHPVCPCSPSADRRCLQMPSEGLKDRNILQLWVALGHWETQLLTRIHSSLKTP